MPSIVPERKQRKRKKKINENEIIFIKPTKKKKRSLHLKWNKISKKLEKNKKK